MKNFSIFGKSIKGRFRSKYLLIKMSERTIPLLLAKKKFFLNGMMSKIVNVYHPYKDKGSRAALAFNATVIIHFRKVFKRTEKQLIIDRIITKMMVKPVEEYPKRKKIATHRGFLK
ncbi:hypothetical protein RF11_15649 [Thelohanellus kitauei]|uniref:Uncharacterized protein n=1 Tax=Thelohanellus kitauei TaxID=669202 RepID=A0A0C2JN83_THEKT|nr:hypothetical protein RF11_15649 [Thelohanellus kitauei]